MKRKKKKKITNRQFSARRRKFIRNERRASMAISASRQLGLGPNE